MPPPRRLPLSSSPHPPPLQIHSHSEPLPPASRYDVDTPISAPSKKFRFARLPALFARLEPASTAAERSFHRLRALTLDPETGALYWVTEPCGGHDATRCQSSVTSVQLLRQVLSEPSCGPGIGFTLDPEDPAKPLGPHFRKTFHPPACADLWSDLLPGAVLFEADWDLKLLLHNVDGLATGLGPWYRTIEELSRAFPPSLATEVLGKVWLVAQAVEVEESAHGIAFGHVTLEMRAAAMKHDPDAPTAMVEDGPPSPALAAFVQLANEHMDELVGHLPSFQYLQQLVLAQEAARFLAERGVALPVDAGLAALRSPLTGQHRVPALHLERKRVLNWAGVVGANTSEEDVFTLQFAAAVPLGSGAEALVALDQPPKTRHYSCGVRNGTTQDLRSLQHLFASNASLDCRKEQRFGSWDENEGKQKDQEEEAAFVPEEGPDHEPCPDGLAVWSPQAEEWRVWASQSPPRVEEAQVKDKQAREDIAEPESEAPEAEGGHEDEEQGQEEEETELEAAFSVKARVVVLGEEEEEKDEDSDSANEGADSPIVEDAEEEGLVLLASEEDKGLAEAIATLKPVGLLLVQSEEARQRRRREAEKAASKRKKGEKGSEGDKPPLYPPGLPVRFLSEDVARDLRLMKRQDDSLRVWLACGVERELNDEKEAGEEENEEGEGADKMTDGLHTVTYDGVVYRTLDLGAVDAARTGCQKKPLPLPRGFEIAPGYEQVVQEVVKQHAWGTAFLVLRATSGDGDGSLLMPPAFAAYSTAIHGNRAGELLDVGELVTVTKEEEGKEEEEEEEETTSTTGHLKYQPRQCDARILIRSVVPTVRYAGFVYRTLEPDVPADLLDVPHHAAPKFSGWASTEMPKGWEMVPINRAIAQKVVAGHPWGTDALILGDGRGYPTLLYFQRRALHQQLQRSFAPHHRILIRQSVEAWEAGKGKRHQENEATKEGGKARQCSTRWATCTARTPAPGWI